MATLSSWVSRYGWHRVTCRMDPLSICASIIALCQAVTAIIAGIREVVTIIAAPDEISDLHNELETVHGYLERTRAVLESLESSKSALPSPDLSHVHSVVKNLEGEVGELARMIEAVVRQMQGTGLRRRKIMPALKWRHRRRDITRRRDKIKGEVVAIVILQQAALLLEVKEVSELGFDKINKLLDQATKSFQEAIDKISQQVAEGPAVSQTNISVRQHTESSIAVLQVLQESSQANHGVRSRLEAINPTTNVPSHFLIDLPHDSIHLDDTGSSPHAMAKWRLVVDEKDLHEDAAHIYHQIINQSEEYSHTTVLHGAVLGYKNMSLTAALELDPSSINMIDDCGCTPLHWAAWKNDISAVRLLLSWKADLDLRDYEGRPALSIAVAATKLQCAEILIEAGADVNAKNKWNWTPLFLATREQSVEMPTRQAMDDDKDTALSSPIYARCVVENTVLVRMYAELGKAGANMDFPNNDGRTPIMKTIRANKPVMFRALWLNGAGINLIDLHGQSILHLAGMYSNLEIIVELQMAEICVDPNLKDDQGQTAVDYFLERTNTPRHALKGDQTKPTEQEVLDFEALIEKTRERYDEWIGSKQAWD
ncbi:hypothetical protein VE02_00554 [Pseudogymnoascus sp. 03VT05]|nr:hypothetical protein VE02_00554 [Pseudogymnoascus sp. 03VT05]